MFYNAAMVESSPQHEAQLRQQQAIKLLLPDNYQEGTVIENLQFPQDFDAIERGIVADFEEIMAYNYCTHQFNKIPTTTLSYALGKQLPKGFIGPTKNYRIIVAPPDKTLNIANDSVDWDHAVAFMVSRELLSGGVHTTTMNSFCMYYTRETKQGRSSTTLPYLYRSVTQSDSQKSAVRRTIFTNGYTGHSDPVSHIPGSLKEKIAPRRQ